MIKFKNITDVILVNEASSTIKLNIPKDILKMNALFKKAGHELYIVGGAVRDALLGKVPKDWDLATDATPDKIKEILKEYKFKEIGEAFAIVFVITPNDEYEIATFREDIGKGRRPDAVKFSSIDKDVLRRDLTINALFYDIDKKEIVDLVGGIKDIKDKNIRTVGLALDRFGEDALRKLRAIRFAARIGGKIDPEVHQALTDDNSLPEVSAPRIRDEFKAGIKKAKKPKQYLEFAEQYNFWDSIFPGFDVNKRFINTDNWKVQLAELLKPNNIDEISKDLKILYAYTEDEVNSISLMHYLLDIDLKNNLLEALKKVNKKGVDKKDILLFAKINGIDKKMVNGLFNHKITTKGNDPAIRELGLKGSAIGDKIQEIEYEKFKDKWL